MAARGENLRIDISGPGGERMATFVDSIAPESACTSVQPHLQVAPQRFAAYWNAAQAFAGAQVAIAANSPFLCGHALWHETRIPLFEQATDTRAEDGEPAGFQGVCRTDAENHGESFRCPRRQCLGQAPAWHD